jgi:SsrA-binding protein
MNKIVNKKAYFEFHILKEFEAGIQLFGSEVKSIRNGNANIGDAFCYVWNNEVFVKNIYISKYEESSYMNHEEKRDRKLLLHKKEISAIIKLTQDNGTTVIPLELFVKKGRFKLKIGVGKGKKLWDKKVSIKERDIKRDIKRDLNINIQ